MIKFVSFDLDGTLIKSTYADLVWLEGLPEIYAHEKGINLEETKQFLRREYDEVGNNREEWYDIEYWFNHFNLRSSWRVLLEKYRYAIETFPEVQGVLKRLCKKFYLMIISNAKREFIEVELEETKLRKYFTFIFSSTSDFHKIKKVVDFYSMICNKIGVDPHEIIHIGDHKEFDYNLPRILGIQSFYLNREKTRDGEFIVYDLKEFEDRINKI
ncbi:MAG: HAD family hydrolase [Thermoplasmatales archaeon]|nr:MAG: HAD family hydrolase [Thermoplasmatales archaeon]